jgi:hypothetical protein
LKLDSGINVSEEQSIFAVGARAAGTLVEKLSYKGEITFEFGKVNEDVDQNAWAGYAGLGYAWEKWNFENYGEDQRRWRHPSRS